MSQLAMTQPSVQLRPSKPAKKPQLPKLRPNINKRAQQIISAHMQSLQLSTMSSSLYSTESSTVPVLTQIESTAAKTARTHDISHLMDRAGFLTPRIPPSLIAEADHIYEASFLPKGVNSVYCDDDGMWHTKVFPSDCPSSRMDANLLDKWINESLQKYSAEAAPKGREELAKVVEDLVPLLSTALHEVVRQVTHHCAERGVALEKIWRTYVELFDRVLRHLQSALLQQKQRTSEVQRELAAARSELHSLRKNHPENMHLLIEELEAQFAKKQQELEAELKKEEEENNNYKQMIRAQHREQEMWYPWFGEYHDSSLKASVPQIPKALRRAATRAEAEADNEMEQSPEVAVAEDFKRLISTLPVEKRRQMGQELAFITETPAPSGLKNKRRSSVKGPNVVEGRRMSQQDIGPEAEIEGLQEDIRKQEEWLREIREALTNAEQTSRQMEKEQGGPKASEVSANAPQAASNDVSPEVSPRSDT